MPCGTSAGSTSEIAPLPRPSNWSAMPYVVLFVAAENMPFTNIPFFAFQPFGVRCSSNGSSNG